MEFFQEHNDWEKSLLTASIPSAGNIINFISLGQLDHFRILQAENAFRLLWIAKKVDTVEIDGEVLNFNTNLFAYIPPGKKLRIKTVVPPEGWLLYFSKDCLNILREEHISIAHPDFFSNSDKKFEMDLSPKIGERIDMLAGMIDELSCSNLPMKDKAITALLKAIFIYSDSKFNFSSNNSNINQESKIINQFRELVSLYFEKMHRVSDYARMMCISPKYLNQVVKQLTGITAKQVIQSKLMDEAKHDLEESNLSIKEIAFTLGFSDPFHFSNFFKELAGSSPANYRKQQHRLLTGIES